jgi:PRC-barrel domain protein
MLAVPAVAQQPPYTPVAPRTGVATNTGGFQSGAQVNMNQQATSPLVLNLSGTTVMDESGQQLGQIQHLLVDPGGCVNLAVLSMGGTRLVPIPWQLIRSSGTASAMQGRTALTTTIDRQRLQQAPSFSINQLPQITQQQTI